jgi:hypothetical protein
MGWASGSILAEDIWSLVSKYIPKKDKKKIARKFIDLFEDQDCDTMDEAESLVKDAKLKKLDELE